MLLANKFTRIVLAFAAIGCCVVQAQEVLETSCWGLISRDTTIIGGSASKAVHTPIRSYTRRSSSLLTSHIEVRENCADRRGRNKF
jgi:hypothetical protein